MIYRHATSVGLDDTPRGVMVVHIDAAKARFQTRRALATIYRMERFSVCDYNPDVCHDERCATVWEFHIDARRCEIMRIGAEEHRQRPFHHCGHVVRDCVDHGCANEGQLKPGILACMHVPVHVCAHVNACECAYICVSCLCQIVRVYKSSWLRYGPNSAKDQ